MLTLAILFWAYVVVATLYALTNWVDGRAEKRMHNWMTGYRRQHRGATYDQCYRAWLAR